MIDCECVEVLKKGNSVWDTTAAAQAVMRLKKVDVGQNEIIMNKFLTTRVNLGDLNAYKKFRIRMYDISDVIFDTSCWENNLKCKTICVSCILLSDRFVKILSNELSSGSHIIMGNELTCIVVDKIDLDKIL